MFDVYQELKLLVPETKFFKKRINGDFLIIASNEGEVRYLNEVAKDFYLAIDGINSIDEIVNLMLQEYNVDRKILEHDVVNLVRELQWQGLVELKEIKMKGAKV